jgi:hypothetical protein
MSESRLMERETMHFGLGHCSEHVEHTLRVCGKHYKLVRHTDDTRAAMFPENAALALLPEHCWKHITHFAVDVELPADAVGFHTVTHPNDDPDALLPWLSLVFNHTPSASLRRYLRRQMLQCRPLPVPFVLSHFGVADLGEDPEATLMAKEKIKFPFDAAKAIIRCHPDVATLNPDLAPAIDNHIDHALDVDPALWEYISNHPHWHEEKVATDPSTNQPFAPVETTGNGDQINWPQRNGQSVVAQYSLSAGIAGGIVNNVPVTGAATSVLQSVLRTVKDDPQFNGQLWSKRHGIPTRQQTHVDPTKSANAAAGVAEDTSNAYIWAMNFLTGMAGIDIEAGSFVYTPGGQSTPATLSVGIENWYNRNVCAYIQCLNANGQPIDLMTAKCLDGITPVWTEMLPGSLPSWNLEPNSAKRYLQKLSCGNVVFGIPVLNSYDTVTFPFPDDAAKAIVMLGGLGLSNYDSDVDIPGLVLTLVLNYGVPMAMLAFSTGLQSTGWYQSIVNNPANLLALLSVAVPAIAAVLSGLTVGGVLPWKPVVAKVCDFIVGIVLSKSIPFLAPLVIKYTTTQEVLDNAPVAGWVLKVASMLGTAADIAATTVEVCISPATFEIEFSRSLKLNVTVSPDPIHGAPGQPPIWPDVADHWVITVAYSSGMSYSQTGPMPAKTDAPINVSWPAIPAGPADSIQVTADIFSSDDWLCGKWVSNWALMVANTTTPGPNNTTIPTLAMSGSIIESLVPLLTSTRYSHDKALTYQNGRYSWLRSDQPQETVLDRNCADTGNNLCQWVDITMNNNAYALAYCWQASGQNLPVEEGGPVESTQLNAFQSVSVLSNPQAGMKAPTVGFTNRTYIAYDQFGPQPLFSISDSYVGALDQPPTIPAALVTAFADAHASYTLPAGAMIVTVTSGAQWTIEDSNKTPLYALHFVSGSSGSGLINVDSFTGGTFLFSLPSTFVAELDLGGIVPADLQAAFTATTVSYALPAGAGVTVVTASAEWTIGVSGQTPLYDLRRSVDSIGIFPYPSPPFSPRNFYLDPRVTPKYGSYYVRHVMLDGSHKFDYTVGRSYGTFAELNLNAVAIHPNGYAIGVCYNAPTSKMEILALPPAAGPDHEAQPALLLSGTGKQEGLIDGPVGITVTPDGRILVLEQNNARIQAFDIFGNPVQCFNGHMRFTLDSSFADDLDANSISIPLLQAYQTAVKPELCPTLHMSADLAGDLNAGGAVSAAVAAAFATVSIQLDVTAPRTQVYVTETGNLWLLTTDTVTYDIRLDTLDPKNPELAVYLAATLQVEVTAEHKQWIVRDKTNTLTWAVTAHKDGLDAQRLISTMGLKDPPSTPGITYLDVKVETKSYIYVLSYLTPEGASGPSVDDYRLDIYNPNGSFLCRTPDPGNPGVNAAGMVVDQWRNVYTLNYGVLPEAPRTEPKISIWIPSTP